MSLVLFSCIDINMSVSILHKQDGCNALHIAAANGHLDTVKYFLPRFGEKTFEKTNYGNTCLDLAIENQKQDVVDWLLQEGGFATHQQ